MSHKHFNVDFKLLYLYLTDEFYLQEPEIPQARQLVAIVRYLKLNPVSSFFPDGIESQICWPANENPKVSAKIAVGHASIFTDMFRLPAF